VVKKWGLENTFKVCRFSIYCTDKDQAAALQLRTELADSTLYQRGMVTFGRPKLTDIIENHTIELIEESRASHTLLAFCGSPRMASCIGKQKVSHDLACQVTGRQKHRMDYICETSGGTKPERRKSRGRSSSNASQGSHSSDSHSPSANSRSVTNFVSYRHDESDAGSVVNILQQSRAKE
jgi:hypothetical protein